jgi:hypothetical protein
MKIARPKFCKEKSIPYVDWGYGLTPGQREKTVGILAFAWDKLVQLVYINEEEGTIELDGFYISEQQITSIYFLADSILMVLINEKEVKILYTTKFYPGDYKYIEEELSNTEQSLLHNPFDKFVNMTIHTELEKGKEVQEIRKQIMQT